MNLVGKNTARVPTSLATAVGVALWASAGFGQATGPFNAAQVDAGHNAYVAHCLTCHGDTMSGGGEAPPIAGKAFLTGFGTKTTKDVRHHQDRDAAKRSGQAGG